MHLCPYGFLSWAWICIARHVIRHALVCKRGEAAPHIDRRPVLCLMIRESNVLLNFNFFLLMFQFVLRLLYFWTVGSRHASSRPPQLDGDKKPAGFPSFFLRAFFWLERLPPCDNPPVKTLTWCDKEWGCVHRLEVEELA